MVSLGTVRVLGSLWGTAVLSVVFISVIGTGTGCGCWFTVSAVMAGISAM